MKRRLAPLVLLAWLVAAPAAAQEVRLMVEGVSDPERLRSELANELGRPIILGEFGAPSLRVVLEAGEATLTYLAADGIDRTRTMPIDAETEDMIGLLVLVASNLVRDQTQGLVLETVEAPVTAATPPALDPVARARENPVERIAEIPEPPEDTRSFALRHPLHLGVSGLFGFTVIRRDVDLSAPCVAPCIGTRTDVTPAFTLGLDLMVNVMEGVALGLQRITVGGGVSSIEGVLFNAGATPTIELETFIDTHAQLYGQIGFAIQGRTQTAVREDVVQAAANLGGGVRLWPVEWFSLDAEAGLHVAVSEAFVFGGSVLPRWGVALTLGLSAGFHFAP